MTCKTDKYGNKMWYNAKGKCHRLGDLPAIERPDGSKFWLVNGEYHRLGGLHAFERKNRDKCWYENGKCHRLGGLPAIERKSGPKAWFIYGKQYTYEQVINYYEILTRFGRYCLKKIKLRRLNSVRYIHGELLCMPTKSKYQGGLDYHKMIKYFANIKN